MRKKKEGRIKQIKGYMSPEEKRLFDRYCLEKGITRAELIRQAVLDWIARDKGKKEQDLLEKILRKTEKAALYGAAAFILQKAKFALRLQGYAPQEMENLEKAMDKVLEMAKDLTEE